MTMRLSRRSFRMFFSYELVERSAVFFCLAPGRSPWMDTKKVPADFRHGTLGRVIRNAEFGVFLFFLRAMPMSNYDKFFLPVDEFNGKLMGRRKSSQPDNNPYLPKSRIAWCGLRSGDSPFRVGRALMMGRTNFVERIHGRGEHAARHVWSCGPISTHPRTRLIARPF